MARLADVNYSINGEATIQVANDSSTGFLGVVKYPIDKNGKITYPKDKEWYMFKLVDNTKQGGVYIPNIDDVWNPETKLVERVRLLSGVGSIWVKDQKELQPEYIKQNGITLNFPRGQKILRIASHNTTALEFMRLCNSNIGNPKRVRTSRFEFFEYDTAAAEQEALLKDEFELDMAIQAKTAKVEQMRKHAAFLGIRMMTDLGEPKTDDGVRREYVIAAKRNPKYFKDTFGSPEVEVSWLVKKAIGETLIEIGREPGKVYWANGGGMICAMPPQENAQLYLTQLAMTNSPEGVQFKEQLQKIIT